MEECLLMNIFPAGCPHGQGGGGGERNVDRTGCGVVGSKTTKNVETSFMDGPITTTLMIMLQIRRKIATFL